MTIDAIGKSYGIQNLKITDLCRHLLFDSMDPALLAGVDDSDDNDTSLAGVPIPVATNDNNDNDSDAESNHNSIDLTETNEFKQSICTQQWKPSTSSQHD